MLCCSAKQHVKMVKHHYALTKNGAWIWVKTQFKKSMFPISQCSMRFFLWFWVIFVTLFPIKKTRDENVHKIVSSTYSRMKFEFDSDLFYESQSNERILLAFVSKKLDEIMGNICIHQLPCPENSFSILGAVNLGYIGSKKICLFFTINLELSMKL